MPDIIKASVVQTGREKSFKGNLRFGVETVIAKKTIVGGKWKNDLSRMGYKVMASFFDLYRHPVGQAD